MRASKQRNPTARALSGAALSLWLLMGGAHTFAADAAGARETREARRAGQVWEVHLILDDGRRQVFRGIREPSRERRVIRLRVEAAHSDTRTRRMSGEGASAPIERIEGGYVSPKAVRRGDRP